MARGVKTGGRKAGTPNKAIAERRLEIARQLGDARNRGVPLAKDRLEELLGIAIDVMAMFRPGTVEMVEKARAAGNSNAQEQVGNWPEFGAWFDRAVYVAKGLAPYESPQLRAVTVAATPALPAPRRPARTEDQISADLVKVRARTNENTFGKDALVPWIKCNFLCRQVKPVF